MGRRTATRTPRSRRLPVEAFLRRRKKHHAVTLIVAVAVVLVLAYLDHQGVGLYATDDAKRYHGQAFEVVRVIDGDTIVVRARDGDEPTTTVRVWGVNTPELAKPDGSKPAEALAEVAAALTRELVGGRVTLYLEPHRRRGRYGRLLAHVVLPDGSQLGGRLIEAGLSASDDRWSHRHLTAYALLELKARAGEVGKWARLDTPGPGPIRRIRLADDAGRAYTVSAVDSRHPPTLVPLFVERPCGQGGQTHASRKGLAMGFGRSNRYGKPVDAGAKAVAETSAFLSWALSKDRPLPRIPRRRVDQGGFGEMMRGPHARKIVVHWWSQAIERLTDR